MKIPPTLGKVLYGALFVILLPAALMGWAYGARVNVSLPGFESVPWGAVVVFAGLLLWVTGVLALRLKGGGLPMNAFPPPRLVTQGVYAVTGHPIYVGFTLASFGIALGYGSAPGQWLVSPMLVLAASALWWGYERIDLRARLGAPSRAAWLGVPFASPDLPRFPERLGSLVLTLATPTLTALMLHGAGLAGRSWHVQGEPGFQACAAFALVIASTLTMWTYTDLRHVVLTSWLGSLLLALIVLVLPSGPFGGRLALAPAGALVALVGMTGLSSLLGMAHRLPVVVHWAIVLVAGLLLFGREVYPSPESMWGALTFMLASTRRHWWKAAVRLCETIANCWHESDLGPVRILHIGWLVALPASGAGAAAVILIGPNAAVMTVWVFVFMIAGSALWAQLIEGSPALSRPYGFFGAVLAVIVFALVVAPLVFDTSPWLVLAAFGTVAPWAQGLARLRCLANGCCHGTPCGASWGIIYRNPRTRVVRLANLGGVPLHPTQLYSLSGNILIGALMVRLWAEGISLSFIAGLYFALMGLARFVEEAWRGEPQTPVWGGLRLYQWMSIMSLVGGAALTVISGSPRAPAPVLSLAAVWTGAAAGTMTWLGTSIDFPRSNRRFARLA